MKAQTKALVASVVVIALALSAVSGITYSWFSDTEETDITIGAGKVSIAMNLTQLKDETGSRDATVDLSTAYTYGLNATATYASGEEGNATLELANVADNDSLLITFKITNDSTIDTVYRVSASTSGELAKYIQTKFTLDGNSTSDATAWTDAPVSTEDSRDVEGTLLVTFNSNNAANGSTDTATIALKAEAYQANTTELPALTVSQTVTSGEEVSKTFDNGNSTVGSVGVSFTANTADTYKISSITTTEDSSYTIQTTSGSEMTVLSGISVTADTTADLSGQSATLNFVMSSSLVNASASPVALGSGYTIVHQKSDGSVDTGFSLTAVASGSMLDSAGQYILTDNSNGTYTMELYVTGFSAYLAVQDADASITKSGTTICYGTLGEAITAVDAKGTVKLLRDVVTDSSFTINQKITLDLNKHTISTSAGYLIDVQSDLTISDGTLKCTSTGGKGTTVLNIKDQTSAVNLTLNNVNVVGPTNDAVNAAIYVENNKGAVVIDIDGGKITANHYPLNIRENNSDLKITADDATIQGYCAMQCHSNDVTFEFTNCTLIGLNQWNGSGNDFDVIVLYSDATGSTVTCEGCTISAVGNGTAEEGFFDIRSACEIVMKDCAYKYDGQTIDVADVENYKWIDETNVSDVDFVLSDDNSTLTITSNQIINMKVKDDKVVGTVYDSSVSDYRIDVTINFEAGTTCNSTSVSGSTVSVRPCWDVSNTYWYDGKSITGIFFEMPDIVSSGSGTFSTAPTVSAVIHDVASDPGDVAVQWQGDRYPDIKTVSTKYDETAKTLTVVFKPGFFTKDVQFDFVTAIGKVTSSSDRSVAYFGNIVSFTYALNKSYGSSYGVSAGDTVEILHNFTGYNGKEYTEGKYTITGEDSWTLTPVTET